MGEYEFNKEFFAGQKPDTAFIEELVKNLPAQARLVLNFDDETIRDIKSQTSVSTLSFGFGVRADIQATDIFLTQSPSPGTRKRSVYSVLLISVATTPSLASAVTTAAGTCIFWGKPVPANRAP